MGGAGVHWATHLPPQPLPCRPATASGPRAGPLHSQRCRWHWPSGPRHTPSKWPSTWNTARARRVRTVCGHRTHCVWTPHARTHARTHARRTRTARRPRWFSTSPTCTRTKASTRPSSALRSTSAPRGRCESATAWQRPGATAWQRQPGSVAAAAAAGVTAAAAAAAAAAACVRAPRCRGQGLEAPPP